MSKQTEAWKNRIVSSGTKPANQFTAHEYNFRRHPNSQREALRGSLTEIGWVQNIIVNRTTGNVIDGHARIEEALSVDEEALVPFIEVELTRDEELLALATLDPIGALARTDAETLGVLLHEVTTGNAALQELLSNLAEDNGLIPELPPENQPDATGFADESVTIEIETTKSVLALIQPTLEKWAKKHSISFQTS